MSLRKTLFVAMLSASAAQVPAQTKVEAFEITKLPKAAEGLNVSAFIVSARATALGNLGSFPIVLQTMSEPATGRVSGQAVSLPALTARRIGFVVANYLTVAVHKQPAEEFFLQNQSGKFAPDRRCPDNNCDATFSITSKKENGQALFLYFLKMDELAKIRSRNGGKLVIDASRDFPK